jgi:glycosyltransferase involved in cell wall biosynthesis
MAEISVIIPTFNRAWTLRRAIDSVRAQSFKDFELIIVDDGSTDETMDMLFPYLSDQRVTAISTPNNGVSHARNEGVKHSTGKWICFLDSDDEWKPHKLREQLQFTVDNHYTITQTNEIWNRNGTRVNQPKHLRKQNGDIFSISLYNCMITPSSVMMTRKLFDEFCGFNEALPTCEDYDLWLKISSMHPVGLLETDLMTRYGGHTDQLSAKYPNMDIYRCKSLHNLVQNFDLNENQKKEAREVLQKKLSILHAGAKKHNNEGIVNFVAEINKFYHFDISNL